jgi:hypothetical protein
VGLKDKLFVFYNIAGWVTFCQKGSRVFNNIAGATFIFDARVCVECAFKAVTKSAGGRGHEPNMHSSLLHLGSKVKLILGSQRIRTGALAGEEAHVGSHLGAVVDLMLDDAEKQNAHGKAHVPAGA